MFKFSLKYNQKDAKFSRSIYFYKLLYVFQVFSVHHQEHKTLHTASGIVKPRLLPAAIVDEMELISISSTIAADSTIVLTIPDVVCTVLCS
jgi:arginine repressor